MSTKRSRRFALLASVSALVVAAMVAQAIASGTTIRRDSATGAAYSGKVQGTDLTNITMTTSLRTVTCNESTMTGDTNSSGAGDVDTASYTYNGGACQNSDSGTTSITPLDLPWTATTTAVTEAGRDFKLVITDGSNVRFKSVGSSGMTCIWKASSVELDGHNSTDKVVASAEPFTEDTAHADNNDLLCPSSATMSGEYRNKGETTAGSGVFDQRLWVTH